MKAILTNFNGVNNIGLEKLYKKSVDNKRLAIIGQICSADTYIIDKASRHHNDLAYRHQNDININVSV